MLLTVRVGGEVKKMMGVDLRPAADGLQPQLPYSHPCLKMGEGVN